MSSFRKKIPKTAPSSTPRATKRSLYGTKGTKPGKNGKFIASSGHRELDEILGGGHTLGTAMLIEEDLHGKHGSTLLSYELAESISLGFETIILSIDHQACTEVTKYIPYNLHIDDDKSGPTGDTQKPATNSPLASTTNPAASSANSSHNSSKTGEQHDLNIAWQYQKYLKDETNPLLHNNKQLSNKVNNLSSGSKLYCCSYDLKRPLQNSILHSARPHVICMCGANGDEPISRQSISRTIETLKALLRSKKTDTSTSETMRIPRIFIPNFVSGWLAYLDEEETTNDRGYLSLLCFLLELKHILHESHGTLTVTMQDSLLQKKFCDIGRSLFDTILSTESFVGQHNAVPAEFKEFCGFLTIRKVDNGGSVAAYRPKFSKYGLKRSLRKLSIEPLHLPPEESRAFPTPSQSAQISSSGIPPSSSVSSPRKPVVEKKSSSGGPGHLCRPQNSEKLDF
jgi:hypothetical protein